MNEFDLIKVYFQKAPKHPLIVVGNGDDGAILAPTMEQNLTISVDSVIAGRHVPLVCPPEGFASRLLGRGVSDLAAMGARPEFVLLSLTLPAVEPLWVGAFAEKFHHLAVQWGLELIGGDMSKGQLSAHLTAIGSTIRSKPSLTRRGAQPGDRLWIYGPDLGGARAYIDVLNQEIPDVPIFAERYWRPEPQIEAGQGLVGKAHAVIDVSDGLCQDLAHILEASDVGLDAHLSSEAMPLCEGLIDAVGQKRALEYAMTGGDDYCLIAAVPESADPLLEGYEIGFLTEGAGEIRLDDDVLPKQWMLGWDHSR